MAWCPKCKNEYREGITVCADCGCELVEEEQFDKQVPITFGDEEQLNSLKEYLEFNKIKGVAIRFDETEHVYELLVREEDKGAALAMTKVFQQQEALRRKAEGEQETIENTNSVENKEETKQGETDGKGHNAEEISALYRNSSERAEENRSSAWTLLLVGTLGLIAMILCVLDVIPLHIGNPYLFYGVMCAIFLLFIVMGAVSMKNAKIFAKKAESENVLRDTMHKWYQENLNATEIDAQIDTEGEISDEILYFKRVQIIKDRFNHQFMNLDQTFLEHYIDEEVYDSVFPGEVDTTE